MAFVPALLGCHIQGDILNELMDNVKEAVELYLETLTEGEKDLDSCIAFNVIKATCLQKCFTSRSNN